MPVGIPTPRHRVPQTHNTVASMREMNDHQEGISEPPPPPPWGQGGWPMGWNQPPPPPPPQWGNPPKWGEHPHVPHPSFLTGQPGAYEGDDIDPPSDDENEEEHSGYSQGHAYPFPPPMPPPPPGYGQPPPMPPPPPPGMPPQMPPMPPPPPGFNPYQFAYSYAQGQPPPPPPPPPAPHASWYPAQQQQEEYDEHENLQVEPRPRVSRRRQEREEREVMLNDLISKMRSTSPSRRQIAKLQRIMNDARESSGSGSSGLTDEQQQQLEALQEMHYQQNERAARRQATHQETVREIKQETRNRDVRSRRRSGSTGVEPPRPKYVSVTQRTPSTTRSRSAHRSTSATRTKSVPQQVQTPQTRSTVSAAARPKRATKSTTQKTVGGRNAQFVKETHERIARKTSVAKHDSSLSDDGRDPVLSFLRKEVVPQERKDKDKRKLRMSASSRSASKRATVGEGRFAPTERDYMEGLEDLHQKLRRTYMEIQKHPQRFLSQLTTHGTMGGDAHVQSAAELLADHEARRSLSPTTQTMPQVNYNSKAKLTSVRNEMDALEAQWDQLALASYDIVGERDE